MERATSRSCRAPVQTCDNPQDKVGERPDAARLAAVDPYGRSAIGSVTKTFVATVVLQLVAEGKLGLDDSVERRLPGIVPNGAAITLRMLLNHTAASTTTATIRHSSLRANSEWVCGRPDGLDRARPLGLLRRPPQGTPE
jgi:CubicO group peptidase (beta-lactamase class C family)